MDREADASSTDWPACRVCCQSCGWGRHYDRSWLRADLIAGVTVAALVVPKSLGYAGIAGVPIQHGLYAAAAGAILYALFGTARQIATGPSSALAAVAASAVVLASVSGDDAVELVSAITFVAGLLFLLLAMFKMGWISRFLSKAVITGFLFGAAIEVVVGELAKITGTTVDGANSWRKLASWIDGLGDIHGATLLVGIVSLIVVVGIRFSPIKVPGALVLVVGGLVAVCRRSTSPTAGSHSSATCPAASPSPPSRSRLRGGQLAAIGPAAVGLLLIGFSQTAGEPGRSHPSTGTRSTSTRSRWRRAWPTSDRACCRASRCRRACRRARSTTSPAPRPRSHR